MSARDSASCVSAKEACAESLQSDFLHAPDVPAIDDRLPAGTGVFESTAQPPGGSNRDGEVACG